MNPFEKFLTEEDRLQANVIKYCKAQYPGMLISHSPNEGKRTKFERYKATVLGVSSGFPDLTLIYNGKTLYLELKTPKGKPTANQKRWNADLTNNGLNAVITYGFDNTKLVIDTHFKHLKEDNIEKFNVKK